MANDNDGLFEAVLPLLPVNEKAYFEDAWVTAPEWLTCSLEAAYADMRRIVDLLQARVARALRLCDLTEQTQGRIALNGNLACVPVAAIREQLGDEPFPELAPCATHEQLIAVLPPRPSDFEPWGERSDEERGGDCSCGCVWFHELGRPSADWGVCFNPESPRAGLLTFEHQGCPQYDGGPDEEEDDDAE